MAYGKQTGESLQSVVTARISSPFQVAGKTLIPEARAGWRHEYLNQDLQTTGRFTAGLTADPEYVTTQSARSAAKSHWLPAAAISSPQNWNYEIPEALYDAYMHPIHDVGGQPDVPVIYEEKEETLRY